MNANFKIYMFLLVYSLDSVHRRRRNVVDETFLCWLMYNKDILVMNINTESIIIFFLNVFIYQKSSYSNSQICKFFINRNRKQYVNKQHDEQQRKQM